MSVTFTARFTYEVTGNDPWMNDTLDALRAWMTQNGSPWTEHRLYTAYIGGNAKEVIAEVDFPSMEAYQLAINAAGENFKSDPKPYSNFSALATWIHTDMYWRRDT